MIESFSIIVDCVTMLFVTSSFVVLLEIANRLKSNDKRFDKIYEKSTCPPKIKSKSFFWKAFGKRLQEKLSALSQRLRNRKKKNTT